MAGLPAVLGSDAMLIAKPILVERLLRDKFDNDDALHAVQRREAEAARAQLLAARRQGAAVTNLLALLRQGRSNKVSEITWQLGPPPPETNAPGANEVEIKKRFGPNARLLSSPHEAGRDQKFYFADLPPPLQNVLRAQLRRAGDVSAVIEGSSGFLFYLAEAKTPDTLEVAVLSIPKQSYDAWLARQPEGKP